MTAEDVLAFWFADAADNPSKSAARMDFWFKSRRETDEAIARRFAQAVRDAGRGLLAEWEREPRSRLALIIVLDQFPRNIHRGTATAFQYDPPALDLSRRSVSVGHLWPLTTIEQAFALMPFQHVEDLAAQREGLALFEEMAGRAAPEWHDLAGGIVKYARMHLELIERFGRFPHRNAILGRTSTPAEQDYLRSNSESFGQTAS
jgi:uncharacterized protein (DUF924 family)